MADMFKAQEEIENVVREKVKEAGGLTQEQYTGLIDEAIEDYKAKKELEEVEVVTIKELLKMRWYEVVKGTF